MTKEKSIDITSKRELFDNLVRINKFSKLAKNWDGYNAEPISTEVIKNAKVVLNQLHFQPEVFPTAAGTIQFEYDGPYDSYLEFQVGNNRIFSLFYIDDKGNERHINDVSIHELNNRIEDFYECRL